MTAEDNTNERQQYADEAFVEAVREHQPASTSEVAEAVGCTRRNADYRLRKLEDEGKVASKKAGNSLIWLALSE